MLDAAVTLLDDIDDVLNLKHCNRTVTAQVQEFSSDIAVFKTSNGDLATVPVTDFYPNHLWEKGVSYHMLVTNEKPLKLSATRPELVELLLEGFIPEIRDGRVFIVAIERQVGVRTKVAVAATRSDVDPVGACLGRSAYRLKKMSAMLLGERLDIVAYHADPDKFLTNALAVSHTEVRQQNDGTTLVLVPIHQLAAALGGGNLNVALASRLTGRKLVLQGV
jgi:N utilization substance protein A